jgi:beta-glucanase (GH16 family)
MAIKNKMFKPISKELLALVVIAGTVVIESATNMSSASGATATVDGSTGGCTYNGLVAPCMNGSNSGVGAPGFGTPKFDDEFSSTSLDTTKWRTGWFGNGVTPPVNPGEYGCMDPSHVAENNGELDLIATIQLSRCGGKTLPDTSGMVTTDGKYQFRYGVVEARIWVPGSGSIYEWPSFWTDGQNWPADGEIDVVEGLGGQACAHYHVTAYPDGRGKCASGTFTGGWHTYTAKWQPGSLMFYYDGNLLWTDTKSIAGSPQYIILDMALSSPLNPRTTAIERVDYVRVWQ